MFAKKGTHERLVLCHTTLHFMPESVKNDATDERLEMRQSRSLDESRFRALL
jgi:hypothetical protein